MDNMNVIESLFRWAHVVAGILWIGLLYFFNWVNSAFVPTMDAETKRKVVPELLPRALWWFRMGAAWTWVTGILLAGMVFYMNQALLFDRGAGWGAPAGIMVLLVFFGVFLYDAAYKTVFKTPSTGFWAGLAMVAVIVFALLNFSHFTPRGAQIHLGMMFGTIMAFNVWFRIWPSQQKIIRAIKDGQAPDGALVALAGTRSKHNTYMSIPLVFTMINAHTSWVASQPMSLVFIVFAGWSIAWMLFKRAPKIKGF